MKQYEVRIYRKNFFKKKTIVVYTGSSEFEMETVVQRYILKGEKVNVKVIDDLK